MMLTGLFLDWYTVCIASNMDVVTPLGGSYIYFSLDFAELIDPGKIDIWGLHWSGTILPLVMLIVFPSLALLAAVYSLAGGQRFKMLWSWFSLLAIVALMANFLYLLVIFISDVNVYFVIPQAGWVLALIGAAAIGIGSLRKSHRHVALTPRAVNMDLLIIITGL